MSRNEEKQRSDIHARVTERIVADLQKGVRPWVQPWSAARAGGPVTRPLRHNGAERGKQVGARCVNPVALGAERNVSYQAGMAAF